MSRKKASGPPDPHWPRPPHPRRVPRQDRSRFLVDVIRTAALRILREEGMDALTTNRIASVAGVAVASVYQYFPNKEAILASVYEELTREEVEARTEWVERARSESRRADSRNHRPGHRVAARAAIARAGVLSAVPSRVRAYHRGGWRTA